MARRQIQDEVKQIFSKYVTGLVQRLKKPDALNMLQTEFNMSEQEAEIMFDLFDKDLNNELSLWEFQQFYNTVGSNAHEIIDCFQRLEKDHSGCIDMDHAFDTLKCMKTGEGKQLKESDIEMLLRTTAGDEKKITLPKFINLMCRLKVYHVE